MRINSTQQQYNYSNKPRLNNQPSFCGDKTRYFKGSRFSWFKDMDGFKQRAAIGVFALMFQPLIDYANPMADEKTRKFSVLKTVVKAVVGTTTGLIIRGSIIYLTKQKLANSEKFLAGIKNEKLKETMKEVFKDKDKTKKFADNLGTVLGLMGVAVGDFTFDMPLAKYSIHKAAQYFNMSETESEGGKK